MRSTLFIFVLLFLHTHSSYAQTKAFPSLLRGRVLDQNTEEPIAFSNIYHPLLNKGTISDEAGYFSIPLSGKGDSVRISYVGYEDLWLAAPFLQDTTYMLKPYAEQLDVVVVRAASEDDSWKWIRAVKKNYQASKFASKIYYQMKSYQDKRQIELVEGYYKGEMEGVDIKNLQLKTGRTAIQPYKGRYFVNLESSTALASQQLFEKEAKYPNTPFSMPLRQMKRKFTFWTDLVYAGPDGDSVRIIRFVPRSPSDRRNLFCGSAYIHQATAALIRLDLEIEDAVQHPFEPIFPDDQLSRVGMKMKRTYALSEEGQSEFEQLHLQFEIDYASARMDDSGYVAYDVTCQAVLQAYDRNLFELPFHNLPDEQMYDYYLYRLYPENPFFWQGSGEFSIEDYQGQNQAFFAHPESYTNLDLQYSERNVGARKGMFQFPFREWSAEQRIYFKPEDNRAVNPGTQQFIADQYDVEVVLIFERNTNLPQAPMLSKIMMDPYRSYYHLPMTQEALCFINIYFDLVEIKRRAFVEAYQEKWTSEEFEIAFTQLLDSIDELKTTYFKEVNRGMDTKALARWNTIVKDQLGIDNMKIFLSQGK